MTSTVATTGRVVVGIDGSPGSKALLAYAFQQASVRGAGLHVIHAWPFQRSQGTAALVDALSSAHEVEPQHDQLVTDALAGWDREYPTVDVEVTLVHAPAATALIDHATDAQLLVVGGHRRGRLATLLSGSVTSSVLKRAQCPVAVVPSKH